MFEPECLTIALGNECNLRCAYCYGRPSDAPRARCDRGTFLAAIESAAQLVARACVRKGRPLTFGFQGYGEPLLDRGLLAQADDKVRSVAAQSGLTTFSFVTSNGTADRACTRWAAERFDRFCLSLDGPAHVHDLARRYRDGRPTFSAVRAAVDEVKRAGKLPACRVTVTRQNVAAMAEVAEFLIRKVGLREIQLEPVFRHADLRPDAEDFVRGLLEAQAVASEMGASSLYAGYRPDETHGPFCQPLRHVLYLTPQGLASACLFREGESPSSRFTLGGFSAEGFRLDQEHIDAFTSAAECLPEECTACPVRRHCNRGCPDYCAMDGDPAQPSVRATLGCQINRLLHAARIEKLPPWLARAREAQAERPRSNVEVHLGEWRSFLGRLQDDLPAVEVADEGATVRLGRLSPGCQHCKQGTWNCIFVDHRCNLACSFCCSPRPWRVQGVTSALGNSAKEIVASARALDLRGLSISGGEPLLVPERTLELLRALRRGLPDRYLWLYTNGVLLTTDLLERLADLGLDEIRFNMAATGYLDPAVLSTLTAARGRGLAVTVEIPAVPADENKLTTALSVWADAGATYLNLHELMRERDSPSAGLPGEFTKVTLADGHVTDISPASRDLVARVMKTVATGRIPLEVNFCSLANKLHQVRGRRRMVARQARQPHERIVDDEYLETVVACHSARAFEPMHPDQVAGWKDPSARLFLVRRLAPLSQHEPGMVVRVEKLGAG
jgi:radical SAM protein with 4Fe4S-binding SPASM domain